MGFNSIFLQSIKKQREKQKFVKVEKIRKEEKKHVKYMCICIIEQMLGDSDTMFALLLFFQKQKKIASHFVRTLSLQTLQNLIFIIL